MEQENVGTIIPGEEIPPNTVVDTENTETPSPEIEARARAMGWRPQEEFNGDPNKWKPAADFVAKGENDLPVLRENLRRTTSTITDLQARLSRQEQENKATVERLERMSEAALKRQRDQLDESWAAAMRTAAANGDIDTYQRLEQGKVAAISSFDQQMTEVRAPVDTTPPPAQGRPQATDEEKAKIEGWINRNPWYRSDMELNHAATAYSSFLTQQNPNMGLDENLKQTEAHMRKRYADKFGTTSDPPAVEGGGSRMPSANTRAKGWNDLPPDARAAFAMFERQGAYKTSEKELYAKEYWSS